MWADERNTEYGRWLLKNYLFHTESLKKYPYTNLCFSETTDYLIPADLFVKIADRIFYCSPAEMEKFYQERADIMTKEKKLFQNIVPLDNQERMIELLVGIASSNNNFQLVKRLATGTFDLEKELFFGWYQNRSEEDFGMKHLKEFYPDLHAYLDAPDNSFYQQEALWLSDYFMAYREAKVKDVYTNRVKEYIGIKNANDKEFWDWYYKHTSCHDLFHEIVNDPSRRPDKVYWIDGLGAEFIPYILYLIETSNTKYHAIETMVATTGLPSNTSLNRFDVDNKFIYKFGELDSLAHNSHYENRKTLIKELTIIRKIISRILRDNSVGNHTIAIVSDHGLSALSRLCEPRKLTGKAHHEGRYIPSTLGITTESMPEYVTVNNVDDQKDYKVALTHASLGNKPSHEVHGGCTPEEVLVPFIVMTNNDASKPVKYDVKVKNFDLPKSAPLFECVIIPQPKSAQLIVDSQRIEMKEKNTTWSATIPDAHEGTTTVSVIPEKGKPQNFDIKIYGLGISNSIMDDFDL